MNDLSSWMGGVRPPARLTPRGPGAVPRVLGALRRCGREAVGPIGGRADRVVVLVLTGQGPAASTRRMPSPARCLPDRKPLVGPDPTGRAPDRGGTALTAAGRPPVTGPLRGVRRSQDGVSVGPARQERLAGPTPLLPLQLPCRRLPQLRRFLPGGGLLGFLGRLVLARLRHSSPSQDRPPVWRLPHLGHGGSMVGRMAGLTVSEVSDTSRVGVGVMLLLLDC